MTPDRQSAKAANFGKARAFRGDQAIPNRRERRANDTRFRLVGKRSERVVALSYRLARDAAFDGASRNAARRALLAEVTRRYGRAQTELMNVRLPSLSELIRAELQGRS